MEPLTIEGTRKTPMVMLNPDGKIKISGRSIPEDASEFFDVIVTWVLGYVNSPKELTTIDVELEYFNSGSAKFVMQILRELSEVIHAGKELKINWYYEEGDDDILERGEYYSSILDLEINFIETE
jgi:hypothetical protein